MLHAFWQSPYFILESPLLCGVLCTAVVTEFNQGQQYHWNLIFKVILNTWNRLIPIGIVVFRYIMVRSRKMAFLHQGDFCLLFQAIDSWHKYLQKLHFFPPMILQVCHAAFCHSMGGERWVWRLIRWPKENQTLQTSHRLQELLVGSWRCAFQGYVGSSLLCQWSRSHGEVVIEQVDVEMHGQGGALWVIIISFIFNW